MKSNALYAQSGGVTSVINVSACAVIETARHYKHDIGSVYAAHNGIIGVLTEEMIDTSKESAHSIKNLMESPSAAFGSCRYQLKKIEQNQCEYERLISVFKAHHIGYFFYNGGGDSADTCHKISELSAKAGYPIQAIHIPKTIDNDLPFTDNCPGFGSVAKYVAISTQEAGLDVAAMCASSTQVFILEVMGRHTGWIAAASGLAQLKEGKAPHIILFPEIAFNADKFLKKVKRSVKKYGYCVVVVAEGTRYKDGTFLADSDSKDAFGHKQLGGAAPALALMVKQTLAYKIHWAVADYLQRSARHIASKTDIEQAYAVGKAAVEFAIEGKTAVMPAIKRGKGKEYNWSIVEAPLDKVANIEKKLPRHYIGKDGMHITEAAKAYLLPLIQGESPPIFKDGLPQYNELKNVKVKKQLVTTFKVH